MTKPGPPTKVTQASNKHDDSILQHFAEESSRHQSENKMFCEEPARIVTIVGQNGKTLYEVIFTASEWRSVLVKAERSGLTIQQFFRAAWGLQS
jgi:hypothetical protein